jgi:hypothetical protein
LGRRLTFLTSSHFGVNPPILQSQLRKTGLWRPPGCYAAYGLWRHWGWSTYFSGSIGAEMAWAIPISPILLMVQPHLLMEYDEYDTNLFHWSMDIYIYPHHIPLCVCLHISHQGALSYHDSQHPLVI